MALEFGQPIVDVPTGEARFCPRRSLYVGRESELLLGDDLVEGGPVVLKAIRWGEAGRADVSGRRALVDLEMHAMESVSPRMPMPAALLEVDHPEFTALDPKHADREPILVYHYVEGRSLDAWLADVHPGGAPVDEALRILRQVAEGLDALHEHGWIHRAIAPEHVILGDDGEITLVGLGNAGRRGEAPTSLRSVTLDGWSPPETEREQSGRYVTPRADIFSMGMLLAWLVTGEAPTGSPASPFTRRTHEVIHRLPPGIGLLIAHMTQPIPNKRYATPRRYLPLLHPDHLPSARTAGFGTVALGGPFVGDGEIARAGHLSAGPLVNRPAPSRGGDDAGDGDASDVDADRAPTDSAVPDALAASEAIAADDAPAPTEVDGLGERGRRGARIFAIAFGLLVAFVAWAWISGRAAGG